MSGSETKTNLVPNYIKASTPELLRESMLLNNLRMKSFVAYQDIQQILDGSWVAWYFEEIDFYAKIQPNKKVVEK